MASKPNKYDFSLKEISVTNIMKNGKPMLRITHIKTGKSVEQVTNETPSKSNIEIHKKLIGVLYSQVYES